MISDFRDKVDKAAHSSITKWLKDLTGSSNTSYDIGPHILVDDLNEHRGKFRAKSESFKKDKSLTNIPLRTPEVAVTDDIYENVESVSKRNRRKFESFKEIKSKSTAIDENIYENVQDKSKFKRHSFSGTKKDRLRKYGLHDSSEVTSLEERTPQRNKSGKKRKERHKLTAETSVSTQADNGERDNYANHASEYELYVNESAALRLHQDATVENEYEVIDALVPKEKPRKHRAGKPLSTVFSDQLTGGKEDKSRRDPSCKRFEKNTNSGGSVKILSRHSVLYHSQNRGHRQSRRSRQPAALRRHSFNMVVPESGGGATRVR